MKRSEQEKLLKEIVSGTDLDEFREKSLAAGLGALRRQRHRRRIFRAGAIALIPALLSLSILLSRERDSHAERTDLSSDTMVASPVSPARDSGPGVEIIDDEQLLALFPGRPVALIGGPGAQRLVFLDQDPNPSADSRF